MPIYGSCAGAIILAKTVLPGKQFSLKLIDVIAKRNDYGRQLDSFEAGIDIDGIGDFHGVFIRAPTLESPNGAKVMAEFEGKPIMLRKDDILITTFHPELTDDARVHQYFIDMIRKTTY
jgi:5'-phosphate synthase pdxT subunit